MNARKLFVALFVLVISNAFFGAKLESIFYSAIQIANKCIEEDVYTNEINNLFRFFPFG